MIDSTAFLVDQARQCVYSFHVRCDNATRHLH